MAMRAAVFQGVGEGLAVERVPDPTPDAGQVVLQVAASGICGSDLDMTSGTGGFTVEPGTIVGHEYAGTVVATGAGVTRLKPGDRIAPLPMGGCGHCPGCLDGAPIFCDDKPPWRFGGYAEYVVADERTSVVLPDSLSFDQGALVEPLAVALHGVHLARVRPGAAAFVLGAGPIAVATVFWLRRMGAGVIVASAPSRRREAFVRAAGATGFLTTGENITDALHALCDGPPELVIDAAGAPGTLGCAIESAASRGTVIVVGWCLQPDTLLPAVAVQKELRVQFSMCYALRDFAFTVRTLADGVPELDPVVSDHCALDALPETFESLRRANDHCKVLIQPGV
jgi:threonine dehydrogenase-like Zn-dependent dehydrogenase